MQTNINVKARLPWSCLPFVGTVVMQNEVKKPEGQAESLSALFTAWED